MLEPDELLFLNPETKPGDWLAEAAYFEAAAVAAFEHLAADLARWWTFTRLSEDERCEVNWVCEEALRELNAGGHRNYSPKVRDCLGLPTEAMSRRLCGELFREPFVLT